MKRIFTTTTTTTIVVVSFYLAMCIGCSGKAESKTSEETRVAEVSSEFIIEYPTFFQEKLGKSLVLDTKPENVVILATSALQIAARFNLDPIAHSGLARGIEFPESYNNLPVIEAGWSALNLEAIIAQAPDLLIIGSHFKENYGLIFDNAKIPTYYVLSGPSVGYAQVKAESIVLAKAFGGTVGEQEVIAGFEAVEKRAADFSKGKEPIRTMILFSTPPTYHQSSKGYLGSMLSMLPIEILTDKMPGAEAASTLPMDFEQLVTAEPDLLFAISPIMPSSQAIKQAYAEELAKNPDVWKGVTAIGEGNIIYLSNEFVTAKGIKIIDSVNTLIDLLEEHDIK